jgi:prolyl-tRNA editing enzyme YbaK/EbsC (Cys-tRNA(Pro) deacylase)
MDTLNKICKLLRTSGVVFSEIHHEPTYTSEASAAARGEELRTGGKAILMKLEEKFKLFVIAADGKIDSRKIKDHFKIRKLRFASASELLQLTGLVPGSVPPFGNPILDLELYVDRSITENEKIAFNAGSLTDSILMKTKDYLRVSNAIVMDFRAEEKKD